MLTFGWRFQISAAKFVCILAMLGAWALSATASAQDYWNPLSDDDLMREARAAFHIGYLDAEALPTSPTLSIATSFDLVSRLLVRPDVNGELLIKAYRLKLQILDRRGKLAEWEQAFNALPDSIPGVANQDWLNQKNLWQVAHDAAQFDWGKVKSGLAHMSKDMFHGEARADFINHKSRHDIRESSGGMQGYIDLATEIANDATWEIDDPYFDPYYGQTDFSHLETWSAIEPILQLLGSNPEDQHIGLRRWFEFAAPSALNPLGVIFPDAPADVRAQLAAQFQEKAALFAPDPHAPVPATGGWRELLALSIKIENLAYTGLAFELLQAVDFMPDTVAGLPDELIHAHKMGWRMFGWGGTFSVGSAVDAIPEVKQAIPLLPPAPFRAFATALLGLVQLSQSNPEGNEQFARAFLIAIPHPLIAEQMLRGLGSGTDGVNPQAVLDILAQTPYQPATRPQVLAARSSFAIRRIEDFPEDQRIAVLTAALADGATALDILERNAEPVQVQWRDQLRDLLVNAVNVVEGPVKAENAKHGFDQDKPIRQNSTLSHYAPQVGGPSNSTPIIASNSSEFELLSMELKRANADTTDTLDSLLATLPDDQLNEALGTLPENYINPDRVFVASGLVRESKRRGICDTNYTGGNWHKFRLKRAELDLCAHDCSADARTELAAICSDSAIPEDLRARAHMINDGIGPMNTLDAYHWAQDWLTLIEKETPERAHLFDHLHDQLKAPMLSAAAMPEVLAHLTDTSRPPLVRVNEHYNLGQILRESGRYEEAIVHFEAMIQIAETETTGDEVTLFVAETRRIGVWLDQAKRTDDIPTKRAIWQRIIDRARHRLSTSVGTDEMRRGYAHWGRVAAIKLNDEAAAQEFRAIRGTTPAQTRLF